MIVTQEEKAKAYDELIVKAKLMIQERGNEPDGASILANSFPELTDSEDEKIRKDLLGYLHTLPNHFSHNGSLVTEWIAWLEKQGNQKSIDPDTLIQQRVDALADIVAEQKPTNKVKPKFKIGDWIIGRATSNEPRQISEITDQYYKSTYGGQYGFSFEEDMHLWSIQDAKAGDVLVAHECLVLFKEIDGLNIRCYCTYHYLNHQKFYIDTLQNKTAFCPATKEQRDTLFAKMEEFGYEWDAEKKELKKIEQKFAEWSEEDENRFNNLIFLVECSDENEPTKKGFIDFISRLKSIIHQKQWKPSDEQMKY